MNNLLTTASLLLVGLSSLFLVTCIEQSEETRGAAVPTQYEVLTEDSALDVEQWRFKVVGVSRIEKPVFIGSFRTDETPEKMRQLGFSPHMIIAETVTPDGAFLVIVTTVERLGEPSVSELSFKDSFLLDGEGHRIRPLAGGTRIGDGAIFLRTIDLEPGEHLFLFDIPKESMNFRFGFMRASAVLQLPSSEEAFLNLTPLKFGDPFLAPEK